MASKVRGHFVWHELLTTDTESAADFYRTVAGWKPEAWPADPTYTIWLTRDGPMGGLKSLPEDARRMGAMPNWLPYIGTEDTEVAVWEAQRLGGKVIKNTAAIPTVGTFAVLQDPQGAVFAVLEPEQAPEPTWPPKLGDFSWHELATSDRDGAFRFYSALFGWEKTSSFDMGPDGIYQMYGWKGRELGGMYNKSKDMPAPPHWISYIRVTSAPVVAETAKSKGARIVVGPMEVPGGDWIAAGLDPQGAEFALHSTKPAARKKPAPGKKKAAGKKKPAARTRPAKKKPAAARKKPARGRGRRTSKRR